MTLITLTINNTNPILMGDLLVSSPDSDGEIETPTFVQGTGKMFSNKDGNKPIALNQKLYIINDRLCVALGGKLIQMEKLLKRLIAFYGESDFNDSHLLDYIKNYPMEDRTDLIAIILRSYEVNGEIDFSFQTIGAFWVEKSERYGLVIAGGSGDTQFIEFVKSNPRFYTDITNSDGSLVLNQYLMSYWLGREVSRADSLSSNWGAGFEMIVFENGRFVKLEYTIVLLEGKFGKDVPFEPAPFNTIMVNYQEDVMIIRAFANDIEKIFCVPTILNKRDIDYEYKDPKHETLLMTYLVTDVDNNIEYFPTVVRPRNVNKIGKSPIVIDRIGNRLRLTGDKREFEKILKMIKALNQE